MSPGALSRAMKKLQDEVGVDLFLQSGRNMVLTREGKQFYTRAKKILSEVEGTLQEFRNRPKEKEVIRIGSFEVFISHFLVEMIATEFMTETFFAPVLFPGEIEKAVLDQKIDFGVTYVPVTQPGLDFLKVSQFKMNAYVRSGTFQEKDWSDIPFASPINHLDQNISNISSLDGWPPELARNVRYHFQMMELGLIACRRGLCAFVIPEFIARLSNQLFPKEDWLVPLKLPKEVAFSPLSIFLVKRSNEGESRLSKRICKSIRKIAQY